MYTIGGELYHYGVKGMKWGVRRYQPYPSGKQGSFIGDKVKKVTARKQAMERKRSRVIKRLNKEADDIYNQTDVSKEYEKWKILNPTSDRDDFDDYYTYDKKKHSKKYERDKALINLSSEKAREATVLGKNYVKDQMKLSALLSGIMLVPITGGVAAAMAPKGKKLAAAAMVSLALSATAVAEAGRTARKEQRETEKKYGIRGKNNKQGGISATSGAVAAKAKPAYTNSAKYDKQIEEYNKAYNKASAKNDEADELWRQAKEQRKKMGKTAVGRFANAVRNKSPEAKAYSETFDKASSKADEADELWRDAKEKYKKTGKTRITRVINNARYDLNKKRNSRR